MTLYRKLFWGIAKKLEKTQDVEGVYMRFHFRQNEIFYFGVWSISSSCLHDTTRNETHCGCYFTAVILTGMKIHFGGIKYHANTTRNEIIWKETSGHAFVSSKRKWLAFTDWVIFLGLSPKRNFISFCLQWKLM